MAISDILQFRSVSKLVQSGDNDLTILDNVSFSIKQGETCAFIGPSGSGKTTLLTIAAGLERPSQGQVIFEDQDLSIFSEDDLCKLRGNKIGFIFQNYQLIPTLTALENVALPREILGESALEDAKILLGRVGLSERTHHYPSQLSGGEQQRVAIVRAFINNPKILFADEPTGSLDRESAERAMDAIFKLNSELNCAVCLVTHDSDIAMRLDRQISLKNGKIIL